MNKVPIEQLQDVWMRMTPRLRELVCTPDGLLGQRIGIAADFPPHPDLCLTDLHKRALEACEKHAVAYPFKGTIKAKLDPSWMCSVIGAESLAAKEAAKPARWSAYDDAGGSGWWVGENCAQHRFGNARGPWGTETQARAVADALNKLEDQP